MNISVETEELRESDKAVDASLKLDQKRKFSAETFKEQNQFIDSAAIAAYSALNPIYKQIKYRSKISLETTDNEIFNLSQGSSSSGLGYSLALFLNWWQVVHNKNIENDFEIFATGEVSNSGEIFKIEFLNEKIQSILRYLEVTDIKNFFLCYPSENDGNIEQAVKEKIKILGGNLLHYNSIHDFLEKIIGKDYDGNTASKWEPFKGLNSYTAQDSVRFFFREKTIGTIIDDLQETEAPILYLGTRKSGKTSLINAGLIPSLDDKSEILNIRKFRTLSDLFFQIIRFVGSKSKQIQTLDVNTLAFSEHSLKIKDLKNIADIALQEYDSESTSKLIIIDNFHLAFNTDNKALKTEFILLLQMLSNKGVKITTFSNKEYIAYFEEVLLKGSDFRLHFIEDFSVKEIENNLLKQVTWAGYKFERSNNINLLEQIINDISKYQIDINIANLLLKRLYKVATIEKKKTLRYEYYERIGKLPGVFSAFILDKLTEKKLDKIFLNRIFEIFYADNINYSMNQTNPFELEVMLDLGFLKYHPHRGHFTAQKLLFESTFYDNWLDHNYLSWYEKIRGQYIEWRTLFDQEAAFDDSVLMNDKQLANIQKFRENYTHGYKDEKKMNSELTIGTVYATSNYHVDVKDLILGKKLINSNVISNEKMKLFLYLAHREFLVKTATRFTYLLIALWFFYG